MSSRTSSVKPTTSASTASSNQYALSKLRRQWALIALLFALTLLFGHIALMSTWTPDYARRWLIIALIIASRELWLLWRNLPANHRPGEEQLLPTLGYGTALTVGRGLAIALMAGFLFLPWPPGLLAWIPAILYATGAIFDYLDGYVARITHHSTQLGETLDMDFDAIGVLAVVLLAVSLGQLPFWYLLLGLARELFLLGHWVLRKLGRPVYDLPPSSDRRLIAGLQMGFLSVVLWPVFSPPATTLAAVLFAIPLTISFGRDWLVTSGMLPVTDPTYVNMRHLAKTILERWLPVGARLVGSVAALRILGQVLPSVSNWMETTEPAESGLFLLLAWTLIILSAAALPLFAAGIVGRIAAIVLIALACADLLARGFFWPTNGLLLASAIIVLQAGSGAFALWQPEERFFRRRAGESETPL